MRKSTLLAGAAMALAVALTLHLPARAASAPVPAPAVDMPASAGPQTIVLSGGCFWGVQGVFEHVQGVTRAVSGYAGGGSDTAHYETVSAGSTGHAESVQITYNPQQISLGKLLQIFFSVTLDPTQVNAQGPDEGTQYRSEIWFSTPEQANVARAYIAQLTASQIFAKPIATRVDKLSGFYPAEAYHQDFLAHNPDYPYIAINDMPKVHALQALFPDAYRAQPVLTKVGS